MKLFGIKVFERPAPQQVWAAVSVWLDNGQRNTVIVQVEHTQVKGDEMLNRCLAAADKHPLVGGKLLKGTPAANFKNTPLRGAILHPGFTLSNYYTLQR